MTRYGFHVDLSSCVGCKACQIACKDKNDLPVDILWRRGIDVSGGDWVKLGNTWIDNTFNYFVSVACMHCEKPICMEVCPTRAITQRNDGIVLIDANICIGCRYCEWACPYGAPQFDHATKIMGKCNLCYDNLDAGLPPACVSACQLRVIHFGDIDELREEYGSLDNVFPLPGSGLTHPAVTFTPHRDTVLDDNMAAEIGNQEEI